VTMFVRQGNGFPICGGRARLEQIATTVMAAAIFPGPR
jgi:hypothetical protein